MDTINQFGQKLWGKLQRSHYYYVERVQRKKKTIIVMQSETPLNVMIVPSNDVSAS